MKYFGSFFFLFLKFTISPFTPSPVFFSKSCQLIISETSTCTCQKRQNICSPWCVFSSLPTCKKQEANVYYKIVNSDAASDISCAVIRLPFLQFFSTLIMQSKFVAIFVCFCVFREICLSLELHGAVVLLVIPRLDFYHHVQHTW